ELEVGRLGVVTRVASGEHARKMAGSLGGKSVLLRGAGEMAEVPARHLVDHGALPVYVLNRTWSRAQSLAQVLSGVAVPFDRLAATMAHVDIVITSTAAPEPLVRAADVREALHVRRARPPVLLDLPG